MKLEDITPTPGSRRRSKLLGRGRSSGHGKTSTRGMNGQGSRKSGNVRTGFEGGQTPLYRRLPKGGFKNVNHKEYVPVNVGDLNDFENNTHVTLDLLIKSGLVRQIKDGVKILGNGELKKSLKVSANAFSASAKEKIESAGGQIEVI
ncbi:50S ribosomal protein L15 [Athalassotoga saccharophila]|uniref:50S ribosomal protein L15 n=1 Tax=Athalassotoga saccharophila TaxID=1441386 RepID=UPI00137B4436|nr:50S ribosomal protein L15 [Athalassotoga saccharophila]BBJ27213.1 50S ribosomal protein L15 [Athalassotoga saccharophila]